MAGRSHIASGLPCDDAFLLLQSSDAQSIVCAIADGAGSARHGKVGAATVVEQVATALLGAVTTEHTTTSLTEVLMAAVQNARAQLREAGYALQDCHATLVAAAATSQAVHVFQVGDGGAVIAGAGNSQSWIASKPSNGEYANETYFFTQDNWLDRLRHTVVDEPSAILLASDGMWPFLWDPHQGARLGFVRPVIERVASLANREDIDAFLLSVVSDPRTDAVTDDDKTLVVLTIPEPAQTSPRTDTALPPRIEYVGELRLLLPEEPGRLKRLMSLFGLRDVDD